MRKEAIYVLLKSDNSLIVIDKKEGLHPYDNDYTKLLSEECVIKGKKFELSNFNNNIATYKNSVGEIKILPSVFSENFNDTELTELIVDWGNDNAQIFSIAFDLSKSSI